MMHVHWLVLLDIAQTTVLYWCYFNPNFHRWGTVLLVIIFTSGLWRIRWNFDVCCTCGPILLIPGWRLCFLMFSSLGIFNTPGAMILQEGILVMLCCNLNNVIKNKTEMSKNILCAVELQYQSSIWLVELRH